MARRLADESPLSLCLDVDHVRTMLGQWQDHDRSKLLARHLALVMARTHLLEGFNVIVPQLLMRSDFIERLEEVAHEQAATFAEVMLMSPVELCLQRFRHRRQASPGSSGEHPSAAISDAEAPDLMKTAVEVLTQLASTRPNAAVVDAGGDVSTTCAAVAGVLRLG